MSNQDGQAGRCMKLDECFVYMSLRTWPVVVARGQGHRGVSSVEINAGTRRCFMRRVRVRGDRRLETG